MATTLKERLITLLVNKNILSKEKLEEVLKIQAENQGKLGETLVKLGYISREHLIEFLSAELNIPVIHLSRYKIQPNAISLVPKKLAKLYCLMPISSVGNTITLAMADPTNINALDDIRRITNMDARPVLANEKEIEEAIEHYYNEGAGQAITEAIRDISIEQVLQAQDDMLPEGTAQELLRLTQDEPVVKLTNSILAEAVKRRSSDIFIEPEENSLRVRFRVDGMLQEGISTGRSMQAGVVSRIKVMSNLDIAEHRVPQDGRFKVKVRNKEIDFRVSVLPTYFGEKVVLRVLDKSQAILDLEKLGFEPEPLETLKKSAAHPHGMIVICGPTGSGKTTTLYSVLKLIDSPEKNIVTVEDPVEFQIEGINQVTVHPEANLTFSLALRSILRQDPDIIMVGEIRDSETADVSVKSALTGHLVLSTLHATTAAGAITRLLNMNIEPFLITSSLLLSGSQRLVRRVCVKCKEAYEPSKELVAQLGFTEKMLHSKKPVFYRGKGCEACSKTGYMGRAVLLEAMAITPSIKNLILRRAQEYEIKVAARHEGMKTLRENGLAKVLQGTTTPEEVMRVTIRDEAVDEEPKRTHHTSFEG